MSSWSGKVRSISVWEEERYDNSEEACHASACPSYRNGIGKEEVNCIYTGKSMTYESFYKYLWTKLK